MSETVKKILRFVGLLFLTIAGGAAGGAGTTML